MELIIESIGDKEKINGYYSSFINKKGDSGFDVYCVRNQVIKAKSYSNKIFLGIKTSLVKNGNCYGFMLLPRSSTGSKTTLRLSNSVGVIDSSYRGELIAVVDNLGETDITINDSERLFQIVPFGGDGVFSVKLENIIDITERGEGGFGSTGA